jgi:hypothetical protein
MSDRARLYNRTRILGQHVQALAFQFGELNRLREQVLRAEEGSFCESLKDEGKVLARLDMTEALDVNRRRAHAQIRLPRLN